MNLVPKLNLAIIPVALGLVLALSHKGTSDPNIGIVSFICNVDTYPDGDPYEKSVTYVFNDMIHATPWAKGFTYYTYSPYTKVAYGYATCSPAKTTPDCVLCLDAANSILWSNCGLRIGGQLQLGDCRMRFENYRFW